MKIDLADVLAALGVLAAEAGTYQLNHWAALILGGALLIALGLRIARANARRLAGKEGG